MLRIDQRSPVPPYEQIREQVTALVAGGELPPGTRLPTIRQLAGDLGLAGGTVARAYRELETDGVVASRGRHGTVVNERSKSETGPSPQLIQAAKRYAEDVRKLGFEPDDAIAAVRAVFATGRAQ
jgi:GntR family transcriptional regulator